MSAFLFIMILGMVGLVLMAVPGLNRHGHAAHLGSHTHLHLGHGHVHSAHTGAHAGGQIASNAPSGIAGLLRWIPSPRMIFSLMAVYGGCGYALVSGAHLSKTLSAILAIIPAALFERYVITPLWKSMLQFEGIPSTPLETLSFHEAEAVTPFRNGRGMVSVDRDGRAVQFRATLSAGSAAAEVRVGDKLRVEEVDAEHERVTVSIN